MNSKLKSEATDFLFDAILTLKTKEDCYRFFEDLCTKPEINAMSQRIVVAKMLSEKKIYNNGILLKADDEKYKVVIEPESGLQYVVGSTGTITTGISKFKNADDIYLVAKNGIYYDSFTESSDADAAIAALKAGE